MKAALALALAVSAMLGNRAAAGEQRSSNDAKSHFERGLGLVDLGRFEEASVEFERAYAISPRSAVLYNIGMAHASARRPSLAVQAFKRYLETALAELDARRVKEVRQQVQKLEAQLAVLQIEAEPAEAQVRVDGRLIEDVAAIALDPGAHVLSVSATGYASLERELSVASGERTRLAVDLKPLPEPVAKAANGFLSVNCAVPDVEVMVDGLVVAKTPREQPLAVAVGERQIRFRRSGYHLNEVSVTAVDGAFSSVDCGLVAKTPLAPGEFAVLHMQPNIAGATLFVDGRPSAADPKVPPGRHQLLVKKDGYEPWRSLVVAGPGQRLHLTPRLAPTRELLQDLERERTRRFWLTAGMASAGLLLAGATAALIFDNDARHTRWRREQQELDGEWQTTAAGPGLEHRQSENDAVAQRIRVQDQVTVGVGVSSGACLIASAIVWFSTGKPRSASNSAWLVRTGGAAFRATW